MSSAKYPRQNFILLFEIRWTWAGDMGSKDEDVVFEKNCVYPCPTWFEIYVVSYCCKFPLKVDFSQIWWLLEAAKLGENHWPKCWPAPVCQKNSLQQVLKKKFYNLFYRIMQLQTHVGTAKTPFFTFIWLQSLQMGCHCKFWTPTGNSYFRPSLIHNIKNV